jgi:hypothetical protein
MDEHLKPKVKVRVQVPTLVTYDTYATWFKLGSLVYTYWVRSPMVVFNLSHLV